MGSSMGRLLAGQEAMRTGAQDQSDAAVPMEGYRTRIAVRLRPQTHLEKAAGLRGDFVHCQEAAGRVLAWDPSVQSEKSFSYSTVFGSKSNNSEVYEQYGRDIMSAVTAGQDATVLVLGRPSTGKSHTVFGQAVTSLSDPWEGRVDGLMSRSTKPFDPNPELQDYSLEKGLVELVADAIFKWASKRRRGQTITFVNVDSEEGASVQKAPSESSVRVQASLCQVYAESWTDLLNPRTTPEQLRLKHGGVNAGTFLDGLTFCDVESTEAVMALIQEGLAVRGALQPQMLGECVPIMVQLRVADTEADTYSTVRLLEMGCFESNPAEIEALDRLQEVSSVDRFWRSFQEAVALVAEDDPEARTPAAITRLCQRSSLTYLLQDLFCYNLAAQRSPPPFPSHAGEHFRSTTYFIIGTVSPAEHTLKENVRILALLDQMELLANGEEGAKAGDDEDGKDPEERGKRPNKASRALLVQELRERIGRLEAQLPKTEEAAVTLPVEEVKPAATIKVKNTKQQLLATVRAKNAPAANTTPAAPPKPALTPEEQQLAKRLDGLKSFLTALQETAGEDTGKRPGSAPERKQWFFKNDVEVRLPTWHRIGEVNLSAQYNVLNPSADEIMLKMGLPLKPTTGSAGSSTMRLGATSSLAGTTMRPASAATDLTSTKRGGSNGGTSTPQPVVGSLKPAQATSTPVTAMSATRRGSKTKATQEPLPAYIKDEMRRPEHALLLPFLVRISRDPICAGRLVHTIYKGETVIGKREKNDASSSEKKPATKASTASKTAAGGKDAAPAVAEEKEPEPSQHTIRVKDVVGSPVEAHATLEYNDEEGTLRLSVEPNAVVYLNGTQRPPSDTETLLLKHNDLICIGKSHLFVLQHPKDLLPKREELMILGDEAAQGEDLNLMLDPILATMAMAEPQLSTLLNEARRHLTELMDNPVLPLPEDLPPEAASGLSLPSENVPDPVARVHHATLEMLRVQLVELTPLVWEANWLSKQLDKGAFFDLVVRKSPHAGYHIWKDRMGPRPLVEAWVMVKSCRPEVTDAVWHVWQFKSRLCLMRDMFASYKKKGRDMRELRLMYPPTVDPFYEDGKEVLIGVGFCFLNSLLHMLEVHECLTLCDKTGYAVGELDMNVIPTIVDDRGATAYTTNPVTLVDPRGIMWSDEEVMLKDFMGKTLQISFHIDAARNLPRRLCGNVFASFNFFVLPAPLTTFRCPQATCNPVFDQVISIRQRVTEDLLECLSAKPIELEVWGAPESLVKQELLKTFKEVVVGDPLWIESLDAAPLHKPLSPSSSTNRSFRLTQTYATAFSTQSLAGMSEGDGSSSATSPRESARQLGAAMASTLALSRMTMTMGLPDTKDLGSEAAQKAVSQLKEKLNDAKRELRVQKQVSKRAEQMAADLEAMTAQHNQDAEEMMRMAAELSVLKAREQQYLAHLQEMEEAKTTRGNDKSKTCCVQ